jgi:hypothetical protein
MDKTSSIAQLKQLTLEYECAKKVFDVTQQRIKELEAQLECPTSTLPLINGKPCDLNAVLDTVAAKAKAEVKQSKKKVGKLILEAIANF